MTELLRVMQIIDENSNVLPEGNYLELCNLLKKAYEVRTDPVFLFEYEHFRIPPIAPVDMFQYFYDYYYDKSLRMDSDFIHGQIRYLEDELDRITTEENHQNSSRDRYEALLYDIWGYT